MNFKRTLILTFCLFKCITPKIAFIQNKCGIKLLDDETLVPDSAFSASSSYMHNNTADRKMDLSPRAARESYDKDNQEFAWCPMHRVSTDLQEYLEIDMGRLTVINFAQTRGRFAQGAGKEFIPYYKIKYRRESSEKWKSFMKFDEIRGLTEILKGPSDPFLDAYETLDPPIITRWIRIYPFSYTLMRICMKLQLFGCTFQSGVLEYRIPQGSESLKTFSSLPGIMTTFIKLFHDSSYDGSSDQGLLYGGLGRLTDNKTGGNFLLKPLEAQYFVGWNVERIPLSADQTLTLWFRFDSVRNFSHVRLNCFENKTMKIAQPEKLEAKFSIQGEVFNDADTIVSKLPKVETHIQSSSDISWIQFDLLNKIGQFVQLKLYFQSDWIILSEVDFASDRAIGFKNPQKITIINDQRIVTEPSSSLDNPQSHVNRSAMGDIVYILIILLCIIIVIIIAISIFWVIMRRKQKKRNKDMKKSELAYYSQNPFKTMSPFSSRQFGGTQVPNSFAGNYAAGTLQMTALPDQSLYHHTQNGVNIPKQNGQIIPDTNIYTSIPGSDNDSTDYSGTASSHPYTQTIPSTSQPQIIGNPLIDYLDNHQTFGRAQNTGICSYDPEFLGMAHTMNGCSIPNIQRNGYPPFEYNDRTIEPSYHPISYQSSPLKNNRLLK